MAVIREDFDSRSARVGVERSDRILKYSVYETEDPVVVEALVQATIPAFYNGLQFQSYETDHLGGGCWKVAVNYGTQQVKEIGQSSFTFDTSGGTAKITQALTTTYWQIGENPIDAAFAIPTNGAINLQKDGTVEGVEITIPQFSFTVTRVIADPLPTLYAAALETLTSKVNLDVVVLNVSGVIYTFQPGELLFLGASGGKRGTDAWEITLKLEVSRNSTLDIGEIHGIEKYGWDYLWVLYEDVENTKNITAKPKQVMTEQVYQTAELSPLFA